MTRSRTGILLYHLKEYRVEAGLSRAELADLTLHMWAGRIAKLHRRSVAAYESVEPGQTTAARRQMATEQVAASIAGVIQSRLRVKLNDHSFVLSVYDLQHVPAKERLTQWEDRKRQERRTF